MADVNWLQVTVALISGGAVGAVINAIVSSYRSRRQPVGHRVDVLPVFRPSGTASDLQAAIAVTNEGKTATFRNLFLAEAQIINKGNLDLGEFKFGITLGNGDLCIYVESSSPDRHHKVSIEAPPSPSAPRSELDFTLTSFNRGDSYSFKLYVVIPDGATEPTDLRLGSSSPVTFVRMPTVGETLALAAREVALNVGPLSIRLGK
ncbi:MAG TPA: hypothetical protein VMC85_21605 [Desulfomonilaceae bacterium]|nr:hypothetical protein [Desulfomonilaceae bacterium]